MNVVLYCGSRSLALRQGAQRAFCEHHRPLIDQADLVVTGDAEGPDQWANWLAPFGYERWCLDGRVATRPATIRRWCHEEGPPVDRRRVPLVRNEMMVKACELRLRLGDNVLCVGFVDPASRTRGTDHTLRLARQAGIWCARYVWRGTEFVEES